MNTRLINRLTAVPSFDGQSLARAKQVDCLPERLRPLRIMTKELRAQSLLLI